MGDLREIAGATQALFDAPVAVAVTRADGPQPALMPEETAFIARAVPKRRAEFSAGRAAARQAMASLGIAPQPVLMAPDRAPIWPAGVVGSISHSARYCVAVLAHARDVIALGVDIEEDTPLPVDLIPEICTANERSQLDGPEAAKMAKAIFCAKEAAYKAQYPITGELFDFGKFELGFMGSNGGFTATFINPIGHFSVGDALPGRLVRVAGHLVTGVTIGQITPKGA